jgi:hypothetical protein
MKKTSLNLIILFITLSCGALDKKMPMKVNKGAVKPGTTVKAGGKTLRLYKGNIEVGDDFLKRSQGTGLGFDFKRKGACTFFA